MNELLRERAIAFCPNICIKTCVCIAKDLEVLGPASFNLTQDLLIFLSGTRYLSATCSIK